MKYSRVLSLFVPFLLVCSSAALAQEKNIQSIAGWGTVIDPDKDCNFEIENSALTITVPGGIHDLFPSNSTMNAPRVLREVEGNFSIQVRVSGDFNPGTEPAEGVRGPLRVFHGAGLLIWENENNYVRLERAEIFFLRQGVRTFYTPLLQQRLDGRYIEGLGGHSKTEFFKDEPLYLRLVRSGDAMSAYYSSDGEAWELVKKFNSISSTKVQVGVSALNTATTEFTVQFDGIAVTQNDK